MKINHERRRMSTEFKPYMLMSRDEAPNFTFSQAARHLHRLQSGVLSCIIGSLETLRIGHPPRQQPNNIQIRPRPSVGMQDALLIPAMH